VVADIKKAAAHNALEYKTKDDNISILFAIGGSGAGKTRVAAKYQYTKTTRRHICKHKRCT
jgi:hypothetical protein